MASRNWRFSSLRRRCSTAQTDEVAELVRIDGLGKIVKSSLLEGPHRRIHGGESGDDDHGRLRIEAVDVLMELQCRPCRAA